MASGNRTLIRVPPELAVIIRGYQNDRRLVSFSATVVELLETHPAIVRRVSEVYTGVTSEEPSTGVRS